MIEEQKLTEFTETLANACLSIPQKPHGYTAKDLENSCIIFMHFFSESIWTNNQHLPIEKLIELAGATGEALKELIRSATGLDMPEIVRQKKVPVENRGDDEPEKA